MAVASARANAGTQRRVWWWCVHEQDDPARKIFPLFRIDRFTPARRTNEAGKLATHTATKNPTNGSEPHATTHLVAEADAEDALAGGEDAADEFNEREDPGLVGVRVAAAAGDDEAVEPGRLGVGGELPAHGAVHAPPLPVLLQQRAEHVEVAAVRLAHVIRVLAALQQRVRPGPRRRRRRGAIDHRGVLHRPHYHG
jgi:hypothetical protein